MALSEDRGMYGSCVLHNMCAWKLEGKVFGTKLLVLVKGCESGEIFEEGVEVSFLGHLGARRPSATHTGRGDSGG